eukprot:15360160-Ditylum_brightwellii.AAC.1
MVNDNTIMSDITNVTGFTLEVDKEPNSNNNNNTSNNDKRRINTAVTETVKIRNDVHNKDNDSKKEEEENNEK